MKKIIIGIVLVAILPPAWYLTALLTTSPKEAKIILEKNIAMVLADPDHVPFKTKIDNDPDVNWLGYKDSAGLKTLPPFSSVECFDFASFVLLARDWDCKVKFQNGQTMYVQGIWMPHQILLRFEKLDGVGP